MNKKTLIAGLILAAGTINLSQASADHPLSTQAKQLIQSLKSRFTGVSDATLNANLAKSYPQQLSEKLTRLYDAQQKYVGSKRIDGINAAIAKDPDVKALYAPAPGEVAALAQALDDLGGIAIEETDLDGLSGDEGQQRAKYAEIVSALKKYNAAAPRVDLADAAFDAYKGAEASNSAGVAALLAKYQAALEQVRDMFDVTRAVVAEQSVSLLGVPVPAQPAAAIEIPEQIE